MRETNNFFAQTLDFLPICHFEKYLGPVFLGFLTSTLVPRLPTTDSFSGYEQNFKQGNTLRRRTRNIKPCTLGEVLF